MTATTIQRLVDAINGALAELGTEAPPIDVESMAILVHEAMSQPNRRFHTADHIFDVMTGGGAIHVLSALYHDVVYYHVDGGFTEKIHDVISPYIEEELHQIFIARKVPASDHSFWMAMSIFGFKPGQPLLPFHGMNEFLSCVIALKSLERFLGVRELLTIACCIEASIPFRGFDKFGKEPFDHLHNRLLEFGEIHHLEFTDLEIDSILKVAVKFANKDVGNFAETETAFFLDNTWKLLPENSPSLLGRGVYTIKKYRMALQKMESFFASIDTNLIFHRHGNEPSDREFMGLKLQAQRNVDLGRQYLAGRLLSTAILEVLSELTGGDAPVVMFVGGSTRGNQDSKYEFDELLPRVGLVKGRDVDPDLLRLFEYEVVSSSLLDFRKSALASYVYRSLGSKKMNDHLVQAKRYFAGELSAEQFAKYLGKDLIGPVAKAAAEMISTRKELLLKLIA